MAPILRTRADKIGAPLDTTRLPLEQRLFREPQLFDFFQAVRILERLEPERRPVGHDATPEAEVVRFCAELSLNFPASTIHDLQREGVLAPVPLMTVAFLGLTGPSGILPRHYTELLIRLDRYEKDDVKRGLRDWLDLFNHRLVSLFYRAWEKYRFYLHYERRQYAQREPDPFTRCLYSFVGLGLPSLRGRLRAAYQEKTERRTRERALARVEDLALLRFGGFLARRPRCAVSLEALLSNYLKLPAQVQQFQGQWFRLDRGNLSALGGRPGNNFMGLNTVVGDRVWDVQAKIRVRLGPLGYERFLDFMPDRSLVPQRKAIFLLAQLVRLYAGPEVDLDIQLVLKAPEVPRCRLGKGAGLGSRLGWNTWSRSKPMKRDADDAVFSAPEKVWMDREGDIWSRG
jgi:type VI secretion system protein ImpH